MLNLRKTTEQLLHSRPLLRCILCSHHDAVLLHAEMLVPVRCCGIWAKRCARQLHKLVRRYERVVRTKVFRLGNECTRLPFERSGGVLCSDPPALVCTAVANCRSSRAG